MWIVRLALRRPYTFVVMAIAIALLGVVAIMSMPTDIFPEVDIPVISVIWQYPGMSPAEMEGRIIRSYEGILTTTVNDIEHIESQALNGVSVTRVYFQPGAKIAEAEAQITAVSQTGPAPASTGIAAAADHARTALRRCRSFSCRWGATRSRSNSSSTSAPNFFALSSRRCKAR